MATKTYDAIVVGSGITGGWAAKELGEKGLQTLVLEAGRPIDPDKDYAEHVPEWEVRYRGMSDRKRVQENQPVQETCSGMDEWNSKFFVNDKQNPYTTEPGKPFLWIRGRQVGGRSIIWGRQSYRWSDLDFEANQREGLGVDWPIRYKEIAPWYDYVEDFIGVSGQREGLPQLPDGNFLPPHGNELRGSRGQGRDRQIFSRRAPDDHRAHRDPDSARTRAARACHYCGPCARGCITRSYFSSLNSTLPAALSTGKVTVRPHSVVHSLMFDAKTRKITGVRVIDGQTRDTIEFRAKDCLPVRLGAGVGPHSAQLLHAGISQRAGQFQRGAGAQRDGPLHGRRRHAAAFQGTKITSRWETVPMEFTFRASAT